VSLHPLGGPGAFDAQAHLVNGAAYGRIAHHGVGEQQPVGHGHEVSARVQQGGGAQPDALHLAAEADTLYPHAPTHPTLEDEHDRGDHVREQIPGAPAHGDGAGQQYEG
jgi:hypothetical protein